MIFIAYLRLQTIRRLDFAQPLVGAAVRSPAKGSGKAVAVMQAASGEELGRGRQAAGLGNGLPHLRAQSAVRVLPDSYAH